MRFLQRNRKIIASVITVVLITWVLSGIDMEALREMKKNISALWLTLGAAVYFLTYAWRTFRVKAFLPSALSFKTLAILTGIHNMAVRILPNPAGEFVFMNQMKGRNIPYPDSLAVVIVNRTLDFIIVACFLTAGLVFTLGAAGKAGLWWTLISFTVIVFGVGVLFILSTRPSLALFLGSKILRLIPVGAFRNKAETFLTKVVNAFGQFKECRVYERAILYSVLLWGTMFLAYGFFMKGFGFNIPPLAIVVGGAVQIFTNTIPNIAGLGVMEAGWVAGLLLSGIGKETAVLASLSVDISTLLGTLLFGGISFLLDRSASMLDGTPFISKENP